MILPGLVCTQCGYDNAQSRGACLMCLSFLLSEEEGGQVCGNCGADNPAAALFCKSCAAAIEPGAIPVPSAADLGTRVVDAMGGGGVGVGPATAEDDDLGDFVGEEDAGLAGEPLVDVAEEPVAELGDVGGAKPPMPEPAPEEIPGPMLEPAPEIEADEDFALPAPPGVVDEPEEEDFAPPPPPGALDAGDADFAPPPPPGGIAAEEELAPPSPPAALDADEDFAPPPPPGAATSDEGEAKKKDDSDEEFGDWSLEFSEDE